MSKVVVEKRVHLTTAAFGKYPNLVWATIEKKCKPNMREHEQSVAKATRGADWKKVPAKDKHWASDTMGVKYSVVEGLLKHALMYEGENAYEEFYLSGKAILDELRDIEIIGITLDDGRHMYPSSCMK
eukprot:jgi/Tetstr1/440347/TSEL_028683.t1